MEEMPTVLDTMNNVGVEAEREAEKGEVGGTTVAVEVVDVVVYTYVVVKVAGVQVVVAKLGRKTEKLN